ncbi:MAG TPA: long-chain-fatty-acid--CoA ligase [Marmoricola sp.]|nr:long-chain-fatty-acid--CoA ligase [Marmoricola sp.]
MAGFQSVEQPRLARRSHWVAQLRRHAFQSPDRPALRFEGEGLSWAQLEERVASLAAAFARRGVGVGSRVAIVMSNRPEYVEIVLAANSLGAMAVPVNFRLSADEIAYILQDSGATVVACDSDFTEPVREAVAGLDAGVTVVVRGGAETGEGAEQYDALLSEDGALTDAPDVEESTPALIMYTSGTTGHPKGAVLTHQNLQAQALNVIRAWQLVDDGEVNLCASPMFHIGAIGVLAPIMLIGGCTVILPTGRFAPGPVLDLLEHEHVNSVFLVPTQWQMLCNDPSVPTHDLSSLKHLCWGAAPASVTLLQQMAEVFPDAVNVAVFGQTEMSPVTCVLGGDDALRKIGSVGRPVPTISVRVVDDEMRDVPRGQVGEIVYRGPTMMQGYWRNEEATKEAFAGGWFHSGDLVRVDDEGFVFVVDRKKDMIISGGENIYCAEVENVLAGHPSIADVSVVGRPHPHWGETPVAVVVLKDAADEPTVDELRTWAREHMAAYKLPTDLRVVPELPRNASGKVLKGPLRESVL